MIEITKERYFQLLKCEEELSRLENGGVDNWEWYSESMYGEDNEEDFDDWCDRVRKEIEGE